MPSIQKLPVSNLRLGEVELTDESVFIAKSGKVTIALTSNGFGPVITSDGPNVVGLSATITQGAQALTGTMRGAYLQAINGVTAATGTIRGLEVKAKGTTGGGTIATLEGASINADPKNVNVTLMRGMEIVIDGAVGGTQTAVVGIEVDNNSSSVQTTSYAFSVNQGTASGHAAWTADIRLQNGELISNATNGTIGLTATLVDLIGGASTPVLKLTGDGSKSAAAYGTAGTAWNDGGTPAMAADQMYLRLYVGSTIYRIPLWADS